MDRFEYKDEIYLTLEDLLPSPAAPRVVVPITTRAAAPCCYSFNRPAPLQKNTEQPISYAGFREGETSQTEQAQVIRALLGFGV
jgi:hypothetical protein